MASKYVNKWAKFDDNGPYDIVSAEHQPTDPEGYVTHYPLFSANRVKGDGTFRPYQREEGGSQEWRDKANETMAKEANIDWRSRNNLL
jgi:hypothetical protein